ncbi:MAG TPA: NADH-quinone oxidoreductase subunit NuoG [Steroidobacteraceae bacterium]|jgi:NADH-quinone oxidoreductase subunit G|nr:NADH-quinone oxidoreductase subunit NuoG [Steroidobacteraceae bacterium]
MSEELVNIEVNGVPIKARKGEVIIRATDREGVYIPRFCYHDKLPIAANCRMCLVEVEKSPKPLPACATPVAEGMKIFTASARATGAQRATMEFLLINHPLDCPICDQGGECELQDLAVGFGRDISRFVERKRVVKDKNLGPLVSSDMTRCIHCTRCVRFGLDIAGIQELGATGRGEHMQIGTYIEHSVDHELSGNIIDLCPVGALNSKPFRYRARGWEMTQAPLISPHDGVGTQLYGHVLRGRLMRVVPRPCEDINETWIADRDRFSYEGVYSDDRLLAPQVRASDGSWQEVEWDVALAAAAEGLRGAGRELGVLAHASSTLEELYLTARLAEGLGSANIDHRLRQRDFRGQEQGLDAHAPSLGLPIAQIDQLDALLVVGAHLRHEVPVLAHRVRKAAMRGARISFLNPAQFEYLFPVAHYRVASPSEQVAELAGILRAALAGAPLPPQLAAIAASVGADTDATAQQRAIAESLGSGERRAIWLGALALRSSRYAQLYALALALAQATGASFGELAEGGNAAGAYLAGVLPHRGIGGTARLALGRTARQMLEQTLPAYLLLNTEPWADATAPAALRTLEGAGCVVAVTAYASEQMKQVADVLLPAGTFAETSGTYVNLEGRWQSQAAAARLLGTARPAWKILRVLGNQLDLPGFDYQSSEQVRDELSARLGAAAASASAVNPAAAPPAGAQGAASAGQESVLDVPMYQVDGVVRRAASLQRTRDGRAEPQRYGDAA